ncbi:hypothetical protein D3C78_1821080 [compost metagenome]
MRTLTPTSKAASKRACWARWVKVWSSEGRLLVMTRELSMLRPGTIWRVRYSTSSLAWRLDTSPVMATASSRNVTLMLGLPILGSRA